MCRRAYENLLLTQHAGRTASRKEKSSLLDCTEVRKRGRRKGAFMKILFISLGCDKNLVDSEVMLGMLAEEGYSFTDDEEEAEAVVINTCC